MCRLSTESLLRRCRTPDGKICSGRGKCDCGICICEAKGPGRFYGPRCECHDWVCPTYDGLICNGAYRDYYVHISGTDMVGQQEICIILLLYIFLFVLCQNICCFICKVVHVHVASHVTWEWFLVKGQ